MSAPVMAIGDWHTNADMIADVHRLGYLADTDLVCDMTYGLGRFWTTWRPERLVAVDLDVTKGDITADATRLPFRGETFDGCVFDPPYKLNGAPSDRDARYGVDGYATRTQRHELLTRGISEAVRVTKPGGRVLVKCRDQVVGGKVRWQTDIATRIAVDLCGCRKVDALLFRSYRAQPAGRGQQHARRNYSTLLVFEVAA